MVEAWAAAQTSRTRIQLSYEETLLGSAGTVAANRDFIGNSRDFYIFYADNLISVDLEALESFHFRHHGILTLGLFHSSQPRQCGIVTLDSEQRVVTFEEKPAQPKSDLANAGVLIARPGTGQFPAFKRVFGLRQEYTAEAGRANAGLRPEWVHPGYRHPRKLPKSSGRVAYCWRPSFFRGVGVWRAVNGGSK